MTLTIPEFNAAKNEPATATCMPCEVDRHAYCARLAARPCTCGCDTGTEQKEAA